MSQVSSPTAVLPGRRPARRTQSAAAVSRHLHRKRSDYMLVHRGRQVRVGPVLFWIVVGTLVIMGIWSIATGTYFAFREDVLTRLIGRQTQMQFAYEDRIAELRAQIDRITSRQLLDQEQFEKKINLLLQRQTALESRASALADELTPTGSVPKPQKSASDTPRPIKPSPISDTVIFVPPPDREARLESRGLPVNATRIASQASPGGIDGVLKRVSLALDKVENQQNAALANLEEHYDNKARRMRSVLADLGVSPGKAPRTRGIGGPFLPLKPPRVGASAFERQLYRVNVARAEINQYGRTLVDVPVRKPVTGEVDMSSPFGVRMDPFLGRPAMHTGIDLRGEVGEPVHATAAGKVTIAGREGGYGKMVQIDHGDGLATRYGHLSEIDVRAGQTVRIGQIIGKIGSTGRSTGPHLHYETRVNGEPVDPQKFLRAGVRLGSALSS
jgi:murein DD-endopeptidase MepM/ murein hydrolase activator NlpD